MRVRWPLHYCPGAFLSWVLSYSIAKAWDVSCLKVGQPLFRMADLRQRWGAHRLKSKLNLLLMREYVLIKLLLCRLIWSLSYLIWALRPTC